MTICVLKSLHDYIYAFCRIDNISLLNSLLEVSSSTRCGQLSGQADLRRESSALCCVLVAGGRTLLQSVQVYVVRPYDDLSHAKSVRWRRDHEQTAADEYPAIFGHVTEVVVFLHPSGRLAATPE